MVKQFKLFSGQTRQTDREIWRIVLPALLENLLSFATGLVTSAMIGRMVAEDISAQGIGLNVMNLVTALFRGIGVGATVVVGIHFGANLLGKCRRLSEQTLLLSFIGSVLCTLFVLCTPRLFLGLFTTDEALMRVAGRYLQLAAWQCPAVAISRIVTAAFNGQGDTRTPLFIAVATNVINACLGYVLIFGLGSIPSFGLMGAAASLVISAWLGTGLGLFMLYRKGGLFFGVACKEKLLQFDWRELKKVFTTGLPASVESMLMTFAAMILSRALLSYGNDVYAAFQLASRCEEVFCAPIFGFQIASTALAAQCVGRQDLRELKLYFRRSCLLSVFISLPCMLFLLLIPEAIMFVLTDKPALQQVGVRYLVIAGIAYIPQMLNMIAFGTVRSMGYRYAPVVASVLGLWGIRIPVIALAAWVLHADITLLFTGMVLDQSFRFIFAWVLCWRKGLLGSRRTPLLGALQKSTEMDGGGAV